MKPLKRLQSNVYQLLPMNLLPIEQEYRRVVLNFNFEVLIYYTVLVVSNNARIQFREHDSATNRSLKKQIEICTPHQYDVPPPHEYPGY